MSGLCCGSTRADTYTGSQWHDAPNYIDDPLPGNISEFMSTQIASGFGPLNVPFLTSVSTLAGSGYTALASVATVPLPTVFAVDVLIASVPQRWFLVPGVPPGVAGTLQPNDYNFTTNQKYWVQLS